MAKKDTAAIETQIAELKAKLAEAKAAEREKAERELLRLARAGDCIDELTKIARQRVTSARQQKQSADAGPAA